MATVFHKVDDKHIPLYRVIWISDVPHFCGEEDCLAEGRYEVRLEQDESVYASREERDGLMSALEKWQSGFDSEDEWQDEE